MAEPITFAMPKAAKKRLPVLSADEQSKVIAAKRLPRLTVEQLRDVLKVCNVRDKAIVYFMADSGLRRSEVVAWNAGLNLRVFRDRQEALEFLSNG